MVCDWWISIHFVCFCVSGFVACDHYKRQLRLQQRRMQFFILSWLLNSRVCVLLEIAVTAMQLLSLRWITPVKLSAIHTHLESTSFYKMLPNWTWEYIVLTVCSVLVHWGLIIFFEFQKILLEPITVHVHVSTIHFVCCKCLHPFWFSMVLCEIGMIWKEYGR